MEAWDALEKEYDSEKDKEQVDLALMALTYSEAESDSDYGSESEEDKVFFKLSRSNLITFIQDLMSRCQEKARHMKILTKQYNLFKEELKSFQNKDEALGRDHIASIKEVSDKILDKHEIAL